MATYEGDNTINIHLKSNDHGLNSTVEIKGGNDTIYTLACRSIHLKKEIYKVGYIDIEYILNGYGDLQTNDYISDIKDYFFPYSLDSKNNKTYYKCLVNISSPLLGTTTSIAKDYVVRDVKLRFVKREMTQNNLGKDIVITKNVMAVQVRAYSPDYCLTQKKFSRVYRGQKLSKITRELTSEAGISGYFPAYEDLCFCNTTAPASFKDNDTDKAPTLHDNYPLEILQPYLVQYNETMHDFLVRVAHRCGELFYYEDGKLILGVDQKYISGISKTDKHEKTTDRDSDDLNKGVTIYKFTNADIIVDNKKKVSMIKGDITLSDGQILLTDDFYTDKDLLKNVKAPSSDVCDESVCLDEALYEVTTDDANTFDSITEAHWFEPGHEAFKADGLASLLTNAGTKAADIAIQGGFALTDKDVKFKDETVKSEMKYSSILTANKKKNLTNEFYNWMRQCQKKISAGMQEHHSTEVNINEGLMLGEFVTIDGLNAGNKNLYYVYSVDIDLNTSFSVKPEVKAQYDVDVKIQYCPVCTCYGRIGEEDSTQLPYQTKIFPPLADIPFIRKAEPQQAIVKNIADPLRNGRVQIQYPWETSDKAKNSPWLHIAEPFTGQKDSGFLMTPDADDTVMVHYEGGNIERPYIDGSLFRGDKGKTNWGDTAVSNAQLNYTTAHRAITSNGNGITFVGGKGGSFVGSMLPSWMSAIIMNTDNAAMKNLRLGGGLVLSDYYGMYSINMSSGSRSISIDSPWGKVDINAFTGITLSAPNGDIKISGKNVTIEAGNKISITSGNNIKSDNFDAGKEFSKIAGSILGSVAKSAMVGATKTFAKFDVTKVLDVSFLRSVMEIILRPVDGSLQLTSKRNIMLQAGKGKITTPSDFLSKEKMGSKAWSDTSKSVFKRFFASFFDNQGDSPKDIAEKLVAGYQKNVSELLECKCREIDDSVGKIKQTIESIKNDLSSFIQITSSQDDNLLPLKINDLKTREGILKKVADSVNNSLAYNIPQPFVENLNDEALNNAIKLFIVPPDLVKDDKFKTQKEFENENKDKDEKDKVNVNEKTNEIVRFKQSYSDTNTVFVRMIKSWVTLMTIIYGDNSKEESLKKILANDTNANIQPAVNGVWKKIIIGNNNTVFNVINVNDILTDDIIKELYTQDCNDNSSKLINLVSTKTAIIGHRFTKTLKRSLVYYVLSALKQNSLVKYLDENKAELNPFPTFAEANNDWSEFISHTVFNEEGDDKQDRKRDKFASGFFSASGLSDFYSYDEDTHKYTALGGLQKLFNVNGAAGPRSLWDVSQGGTILMSSSNSFTTQLADSGQAHWATIVNARPALQEIMKKINLS